MRIIGHSPCAPFSCRIAGIAVLMFIPFGAGAAAGSYWTQQQCLNAAQICREKCQAQIKDMCKGVSQAQWSNCYKKYTEENHDCIYVRCETDSCFKLPNK